MKFKIITSILILTFSLLSLNAEDNEIVTRDHTPGDNTVTGSEDDYNRVLTINPVKGDRDEALKYHKIASQYYRQKKYNEAEIAWIKCVYADPSWARSYYNLACKRVLMNDSVIAIALINTALQLSNGTLLEKIMEDKDLDSIKNEKAFLDLVQKYRNK
ncbi:MAG: hypothetical protein JW982_05110 [Spirochaetes bacterium]|nr:hypothetical protein [Spirochaetota bacterium]